MKKLMFTFLLTVSFCKGADVPESWAQAIQKLYPNIEQETVLELDDKEIIAIPDNLDLPNLQDLFLSNNHIATIPYLNLPNLENLGLSNNGITAIPYLDLPNLQGLGLNNNRITAIPDSLNLPELEEFDLSNNHIKHIDPGILKQFPMLNTINLSHNPLSKEDVDDLIKAANKAHRKLQIIAHDKDYFSQPSVMAPDNYYSEANLARLNAAGERKHAPLAIIIDQNNEESPHTQVAPLTGNFALMLQEAFVPIIVSSSVVHNYFFRRMRASNDDSWAIPKNNPVAFEKWQIYDIPHSQFFLFVPYRYTKYYKDSLGLNLEKFKEISKGLETSGKDIIKYIESNKGIHSPFSIDNLRTILTTTKQAKSTSSESEQAELKQEAQLPIWDIILHGHGRSGGKMIGGLSSKNMQELLNFFNNYLPVGLFYIESCSAGGDNLDLLEFDTTINKEKVLRNLNYILIVGAISDKPTWFTRGETNKLFYQLYSNAARLEGKGQSLDTLLNNLNRLYRHSSSPHGSSNIPQVWLPGGLGFQTYQINDKVQVIGNVKVRVHENEQRSIELPDSTMVVLIYAKNINTPLMVQAHKVHHDASHELNMRKAWENVPNVAEFFKKYDSFDDLKNNVVKHPLDYPALTHILPSLGDEKVVENAIKFLYPEFISMLRDEGTHQYFSKIELQPPVGKEKELTGVMHFIRDAFFDIKGQSAMKIFLIEELIGNNDISALLELDRLEKDTITSPDSLEAKLTSSIGKQIKLQNVLLATTDHATFLGFIFAGYAWGFTFENQKSAHYWKFNLQPKDEYSLLFDRKKSLIIPEEPVQKPISKVLQKKRA